eukprot:1194978-Prorocentrum_minimum.AAC.4
MDVITAGTMRRHCSSSFSRAVGGAASALPQAAGQTHTQHRLGTGSDPEASGLALPSSSSISVGAGQTHTQHHLGAGSDVNLAPTRAGEAQSEYRQGEGSGPSLRPRPTILDIDSRSDSSGGPA